MFFEIDPQEITTTNYEGYSVPSENILNILVLNPTTDVQKSERLSKVCLFLGKKQFFRPFWIPDVASVEKPILESKIETALIDNQETYENALLDDLLSESYIIRMPPSKKLTLQLKVKKIEKPGPFV